MEQNSKEVDKLLERLNYEFKDKNLIIEALTHKSCKKRYNYERLEFLGDAVLDLVIGEFLYKKLVHDEEGILSKTRAALVNEGSFCEFAKQLNLGDALYLSSAEEKSKGRLKPSLLSDVFEAVMGAVYLDSGLDKVKEIVYRLYLNKLQDLNLSTIIQDYKTSLQEITQAEFGVIPVYKVVSTEGPDHDKIFEMSISIANKQYAIARGKSKKEAQQNCAKIALELLKDNHE